jgi:hypothetical protein
MKTNKRKEKTLKICVGHHTIQDKDKQKTTKKKPQQKTPQYLSDNHYT